MNKYNKINLALLVKQARNGKNAAQKAIFEHFYGYIMSISLRYMSNREEAEEVLNDSFLKIFMHLDQYDYRYPFHSWISKITVNSSLDALRKKKREFRLEEYKEQMKDAVQESVVDCKLSDTKEVLPIIQELPPQYRIVFNLYVFEEYKHREIAEKLGISEGTSKSNLSRAKTILAKKMRSDPKFAQVKEKQL